MSPTIGALVAELVGVILDVIGRANLEQRDAIARELEGVLARVRRLAPLSAAIHDAAEARRRELRERDTDPGDGGDAA